MSDIINMVIKMLIINNVKVPLDCTNYKTAISSKLKISENDITNLSIIKKAIDSRNKNDVFFICNFIIEINNKVKALEEDVKRLKTDAEVNCFNAQSMHYTIYSVRI